MSHTASRYHDISCGHRVYGHESKCANLHGHNYRIHFDCEPEGNLDKVGRVIDFGVMKDRLCLWLEENWDHRMLIWEQDPIFNRLFQLDTTVRYVPFNPTAENMAQYLVETIGPHQLEETGVKLVSVTVEETRKCCAHYSVYS